MTDKLHIDELVIGPDHRIDDDPEQLADLAESIKALGLLQPLIVRAKTATQWEVVAGRRRLVACRLAGVEWVECSIREMDDEAALDVALTENLHRRDLSPIEEAYAYNRMHSRGMSQKRDCNTCRKISSTHLAVLTHTRVVGSTTRTFAQA